MPVIRKHMAKVELSPPVKAIKAKHKGAAAKKKAAATRQAEKTKVKARKEREKTKGKVTEKVTAKGRG